MGLIPETIDAISLHQPYASLIAAGLKTLETRKTRTHKRGRVLICSTQVVDLEAVARFTKALTTAQANRLAGLGLSLGGPVGKAICTVEIVGCRDLLPEDEAAAWFYAPGRHAWELRDPEMVHHASVRGTQGWFKVQAFKVPPRGRLADLMQRGGLA